MTIKRTPPEDEILLMVAELRPFVKTGETVIPFIRRNKERLRLIVQEESWATLARVMTALGMIYSTGKPWTAKTLEKQFYKAAKPLKGWREPAAPQPPLGMTPVALTHIEDGAAASNPAHGFFPNRATRAHEAPAPAPTLPAKRYIPAAKVRRPEPPRILTKEETARREALDERFFGKKP